MKGREHCSKQFMDTQIHSLTRKDFRGLTHLEVHSALLFDNGRLLQLFFGVHLPGFFGLCIDLWQLDR